MESGKARERTSCGEPPFRHRKGWLAEWSKSDELSGEFPQIDDLPEGVQLGAATWAKTRRPVLRDDLTSRQGSAPSPGMRQTLFSTGLATGNQMEGRVKDEDADPIPLRL